MGQGSEELTTQQIEDDIEATRARLSRDVDELGYKVSPGQVMSRQKQAAKGRLMSMKDRVMGSAHDARSSVGGTASGAAHSVGDTASGAVQTLESRTEGNPLAAGVIAFGAGMLVSSLIPATRAEQNLAQQGMDAAKEHGQPIMEQAKGMAQDMGADLKESARGGAEEVKATAQDSAETLKEEGRGAAQHVQNPGTTSG